MPNLLLVVTVWLLLWPTALAALLKPPRRVLLLSQERDAPPAIVLIEQEPYSTPDETSPYRETTLTERYKGEMIGTLLIFAALVVLIGYLLIERRRLALVERELKAEAQFERLISELSSCFIDI